jgi:hypothetical protein
VFGVGDTLVLVGDRALAVLFEGLLGVDEAIGMPDSKCREIEQFLAQLLGGFEWIVGLLDGEPEVDGLLGG